MQAAGILITDLVVILVQMLEARRAAPVVPERIKLIYRRTGKILSPRSFDVRPLSRASKRSKI